MTRSEVIALARQDGIEIVEDAGRITVTARGHRECRLAELEYWQRAYLVAEPEAPPP